MILSLCSKVPEVKHEKDHKVLLDFNRCTGCRIWRVYPDQRDLKVFKGRVRLEIPSGTPGLGVWRAVVGGGCFQGSVVSYEVRLEKLVEDGFWVVKVYTQEGLVSQEDFFWSESEGVNYAPPFRRLGYGLRTVDLDFGDCQAVG